MIAARNAFLMARPGTPHISIPPNGHFFISRKLGFSDNLNWTGYSFDVCIRVGSVFPTVTNHEVIILGPYGINTWAKYFGIYGKRAPWFQNPDVGVDISSIYDGQWHNIHLQKNSVTLDGVSHTRSGGSWTTSGLWAAFSVSAMKMPSPVSVRSLSGYDSNGVAVFNLTPIKNSDGNGAFYDSVSETIVPAEQTTDMPSYVTE